MRFIGLLTYVFCLMLPGVLSAQQDNGRTGTWVIEPYDPEQDTIEVGRDHDLQISTRVLPLRLAKNVEDIVDNDGKVLALAQT
ncbi:hypothetical protein [Qipengyuania sp. ASV99]|uniref:hypothetical protein n=1 Tax=Qipengyuania sp. ASV99 TaxID=3399681 RepID=UPI003A4C510B